MQGAEIPAHIIWKDTPFTLIRAEIPPPLKIKQVFNVAKEGWKRKSFGFIVEKVEIDGYLGMVLKSRKLNAESADVWVNFSFLKENQTIEKVVEKIHLFRPKVVIGKAPKTIKVNLEKDFASTRIPIRNDGEGTAIVLVKVHKNSEIKRKLPKFVQEFRKNLYKDTKKNLSSVKKEFPKHFKMVSEYVDALYSLLMEERTERKDYKRLERLLGNLIRVFEKERDFAKAFAEAIGEAYLKNIQLLTVFEDFLASLNSIVSKRILIPDPLWVFPISTRSKKLRIQILTTDLLLSDYPPIDVPIIKLFGDKSGEVPIYRLFEWG